jgi:hypothetical protein
MPSFKVVVIRVIVSPLLTIHSSACPLDFLVRWIIFSFSNAKAILLFAP